MKKIICFHLDNLSLRGTTTSIKDYSIYNELLLNNKSIIAFDEKLLLDNRDQNFSKRYEIVDFFKERFDVIKYNNKNQLANELRKRKCEYIYFLKSGYIDDNYLEGFKNLIHVVFDYNQKHGHRYAYISDWLARKASNNIHPFVPHIVTLPTEQTENWRLKLNIPSDKIVIGRHGGFYQFDINFSKDIINFIVNSDDIYRFIFVNTEKFIDHPNVIFVDPILDSQDKTNFILACNAGIHNRSCGESFGLSIFEYLFHNRPVFTCGLGRDKNNVEVVNGYDLCYYNQYQLLEMIFKLKYRLHNYQYNDIAKEYTPEKVMKKFDEVFLND